MAFESRLIASQRLTPSVRELVFERIDGEPLRFQPGQWVNLFLPLPGGDLKRAYSVASAPTQDTGRFELAVTRVGGGPGSEFLHELREGSIVSCTGPHGVFTRDARFESPSLFVATGTGVTPIRSMIRAAIDARTTAPLWLLFGARNEDDVVYGDEFRALADRDPLVRYDVTLSQGSAGWTGRRGYVQTHVPELLGQLQTLARTSEAHVYVCGLDRMVSTTRDLLRNELGLDRKRVHTERYD